MTKNANSFDNNPLETLTNEKEPNNIEEQDTDKKIPHQLRILENQQQLDNANKKHYVDGDIAYDIGKGGLIMLILGGFIYLFITKSFHNAQLPATIMTLLSVVFSIINVCYIYRAVKNYSESMILAAAIFTVMFNPWNLAPFIKYPAVTLFILIVFGIHWSTMPITKKIETKHK